ncbi:MAG: tRNA dihydrouridine synthase DusB [Phycisphaerae bacterium]|nr:tRNA dihydrouridine synthase DusB [Phycisphaerae bacterium]
MDRDMLSLGTLALASPLLLSPIARYCDLAFRLLVRPLGGLGLACTDLVNPRGLLRATPKSMELVSTDPRDRPLSIQLYGTEPGPMTDAAQWCQEHGADVIDLNMGCPAAKITRHAGGAALLCDPRLAVELARRVVGAVRVPVTVKMRLGWDDDSIVAPELAAAMEDAGVAGVTVHGRTAAQRFGGQVRLTEIARVVARVRRIPVIGNGDVRSPADARTMIERTGCRGVMIGRAALRDPWIFRDTYALLTTGHVPPPPSITDRLALVIRHFENLRALRGDRIACVIFRQRASWYLGSLPDRPGLRQQIRLITSPQQFYHLIETHWGTTATSTR